MSERQQEQDLRQLGVLIHKSLNKIYGVNTAFFICTAPASLSAPHISNFLCNTGQEALIKWLEETIEHIRVNDDALTSKEDNNDG